MIPLAATTTNSITISTIALFAGVIGVALGWLLGELTKLVKCLAEGRQRKLAEERSRVLEFIHCAELISTTGNGIGMVHAAAADGRPVDTTQATSMANQFNEAVIQLNRLRLEIAILGPDWVKDHAVKVENGTLALMTALTNAERQKNKAAFQEMLDRVNEFKTQRSELIDAAKVKYA